MSPHALKTASLKMAPPLWEGPVGVYFKARGGKGASLSGPAPGSTFSHALQMFPRNWQSTRDLYHFCWGFAGSSGPWPQVIPSVMWTMTIVPVTSCSLLSGFPLRPSKTCQTVDWTKASGALPKDLLAWKISSFFPSITLNLLNTLKQSQQDGSPSDPRVGRCFCGSSPSAPDRVVLTHLACTVYIIYEFVCICVYMCMCISMFICLWLKKKNMFFLEFTATTGVCVYLQKS